MDTSFAQQIYKNIINNISLLFLLFLFFNFSGFNDAMLYLSLILSMLYIVTFFTNLIDYIVSHFDSFADFNNKKSYYSIVFFYNHKKKLDARLYCDNINQLDFSKKILKDVLEPYCVVMVVSSRLTDSIKINNFFN